MNEHDNKFLKSKKTLSLRRFYSLRVWNYWS